MKRKYTRKKNRKEKGNIIISCGYDTRRHKETMKTVTLYILSVAFLVLGATSFYNIFFQ